MEIKEISPNNPSDDNEKFITDMINLLVQETARYFENTLEKKLDMIQLLKIRDAIIGYNGHMINIISHMMQKYDEKYISEFLDDSEKLFEKTISQIRKERNE